jgi:hypothetical protein
LRVENGELRVSFVPHSLFHCPVFNKRKTPLLFLYSLPFYLIDCKANNLRFIPCFLFAFFNDIDCSNVLGMKALLS